MTQTQTPNLYDMIYKKLSARMDAAINELVATGNDKQLTELEAQLHDLISNCIEHGLYLQQRRRWIEVPGSEEADTAALMDRAKAYQESQAQEPPLHTE